jgi:hypothetical protein
MYRENKTFIDELNKFESIEDLLKSTGQRSHQMAVSALLKEITDMRFKHDLEYWCITCIKIKDKESERIIPFKLNRPQRRLLARLEKMRTESVPIRIILLKARQWGGSTLVQIYMAWIQIIHRTNWHSVVVTDVEEQARNIRGMYSRLANKYPSAFGVIDLNPYEGSSKTKILADRGCTIGIGSVQKPEGLRSFDLAMSHLSEVAFFKSTPQRSAEDLVQNIRAGIASMPYTLAVLESTAKGVGNFFHREWQAAVSGKSNYDPVFIPWFEIERYQHVIPDKKQFIEWMMTNDYAQYLWAIGATLEGIKWYFDTKIGENYDDWRMKSEFPSSAEEAFQSTGARVFAQNYVNAARKNCKDPEFRGDVKGRSMKGKDAFEDLEFQQNDKGQLSVWNFPDKTIEISDRYCTVVDIGGRTKDADWSVIKVFDRYFMTEMGVPEVAAVWEGHIDQDLVSWKAAQISRLYNNALLIVEFNSLKKEQAESEGDHHLTVLNEIVKFYKNIFARNDPEKIRQGIPAKYGFHTNSSTKPMIIDELNGSLREETYIERDARATYQMDTYEIKPDGSYGAVEGQHDDHVMVTAIGVWACLKYMPMPREVVRVKPRASRTIVSEASI